MTGRQWLAPVVGLVGAIAQGALAFWLGYHAAEMDRQANFNDDVLLDVTQVEIRPLIQAQ